MEFQCQVISTQSGRKVTMIEIANNRRRNERNLKTNQLKERKKEIEKR